jgi:hypothetical protein
MTVRKALNPVAVDPPGSPVRTPGTGHALDPTRYSAAWRAA